MSDLLSTHNQSHTLLWAGGLVSAPTPELGQVGHGGELVRMVHSKVLRMHHLRDVQVLLSQGHGVPHILQLVLGVQGGMVWNEAWFTVVH